MDILVLRPEKHAKDAYSWKIRCNKKINIKGYQLQLLTCRLVNDETRVNVCLCVLIV